MTQANAEAAFHQSMLEGYHQLANLGYRANYFLQMVQEHGGVEAARRLLGQPNIAEGLTRLREMGRLDLSVEALVLRPEYASLFTHEERTLARQHLADLSYRAPWDQPDASSPPTPTPPVGAPSLVERLARAVSNTHGDAAQSGKVWLFQARPDYFDLAGELKRASQGDDDSWSVTRYRTEMRAGDTVILWQSGAQRGVYALAELTGEPYQRDWEPDEATVAEQPYKAEEWWAPLRFTRILDQPILAPELQRDPVLRNLMVFRAPTGTNFKVTPEEWAALQPLLAARGAHPAPDRTGDGVPSSGAGTGQSETTGVEAGLSGQQQIQLALQSMLANGGTATTQQIYGAVEAHMGNSRLSDAGRASLRYFINSVAVKAGYVFPHDPATPGWRITPAGEELLGLSPQEQEATLNQHTSNHATENQITPPEPLDGSAFVVIHGEDFGEQCLGSAYTFTRKAGGAPVQLLDAVRAWQGGGPPVYLIIYRPGPHYTFSGWALVTTAREEPYPGTDETLYILEYEWHPFPVPVSARAMQSELAWLNKGLNIAFRGKSIRAVSADDVRAIVGRAYPGEPMAMSAADAAYLVLSRAGGGPLHLSDLLERIQAEGLAEFRAQTPQLSLSSTLLRDERFHNLGKNTWVLAATDEPDGAEAVEAEIIDLTPEPPTRTPAIYADNDARFWRVHFPRELWGSARRAGVIAIGWPLDSPNQSSKRFRQIQLGDRVVAYVQGGVVGGIGAVAQPFDLDNPRAGLSAETLGDEFTQYLRVAWADAPAEPVDLLSALRHRHYTNLYNRVKNPHTVIPLSRDDYVALLSLLRVDDAGLPASETRLPNVWGELSPYLSLARAIGERTLSAALLQELARTLDPPPAEPLDADDLVAELLQLRLVEAADATRYRRRPYAAGDETALLRLCALGLLVPVEGSADHYALPARSILPRLAAAAEPQPVERFAPELAGADSVVLAGWYAEASLVAVEDDTWRPGPDALEPLPGDDAASLAYNQLLQTLLADVAGTLTAGLAHVETDAALPPVEDLDSRLRELGQDLLFDNTVVRRVYRSLLAGRHVVLSGPPGTGKTELARRLPSLLWREAPATFNRLTLSPDRPPVEQVTEQRLGYAPVVVTATEDWGVRDVVGGIGPRLDGQSGALSYTIEHGALTRVLLQHYDETGDGRRLPPPAAGFARRDYRPSPRERYRGAWLVIDEFTRAPIDAAFGSLLTTLSGGRRATLAVPTREGELREVPLPRDFRIIGTLNSFDRHFLNQLSEAMKRRFDFIDVLPPPPAYAEFEQGIAVKEALRRMHEDGFAQIEPAGDEPSFRWPGLLRVEPIEDGDGMRRYRCVAEAPEAAAALDSFWRLFGAIRVFRQLGTAQMVAVYLNLLTGVRVGMPWPEALDTALADGLADQLQVLSRDEQRTADAVIEHAGQPAEFAAAIKAIVRELPPGRRAGYLYALRERDAAVNGSSDIAVREDATLSDQQIARVFAVGAPLSIPKLGVFRRRLRDLIGERGL